jgi:hypothetical protein
VSRWISTHRDARVAYRATPTVVGLCVVTVNNLAFNGITGDGRHLYFVPDTFSTVARFDAKFPPYGSPLGMSFSSY